MEESQLPSQQPDSNQQTLSQMLDTWVAQGQVPFVIKCTARALCGEHGLLVIATQTTAYPKLPKKEIEKEIEQWHQN